MNEEVQEHDAEQAQEEKPSPGLVLLKARERLGLSITDVARQLRLSTRQIEAIEADDYERLPGKTFLRGFIRNYAKLLQLDPEPLLGINEPDLKSQSIVVPTSKIEFGGKPRFLPFSDHAHRPLPKFAIAAAAVILLLSWGVYELVQWLPTSSSVEKVEVAEEQAPVSPSGENAPAPGLAQMQEDGQPLSLPLPAESTGQAASSVPAPLAAPAQAPATAPSPPPVTSTQPMPAGMAPVAPATGPPVAAVAEENAKRLEFVFEDEAWVQVKDKDGRVLLSQLNPKGSRQTVQGVPPFGLIVGNATHVKVTYNAKQIDLSPHSKMDVARLTLE